MNGKNTVVKANGQFLELKISNDEELIPEDLKEIIFEPFYRMSGVENQTGKGIGRALAHSLTDMHQGSLTLDTNDGTMNSFVLVLPILPVAPSKRIFSLFKFFNF